MILNYYNSNFVTYETALGIYSIKDISEGVYPLGDHEGTSRFEYNDITMNTKHFLTHFGSTFGKLGFDQRTFFIKFLRFPAFWDHKRTNAIHTDSPGVYTSEKV